MQHDIFLKQVNFLPLNPYGKRGGGGAVGNIFDARFLHFVIPINLICNMAMLCKVEY